MLLAAGFKYYERWNFHNLTLRAVSVVSNVLLRRLCERGSESASWVRVFLYIARSRLITYAVFKPIYDFMSINSNNYKLN